MEDSPVGPRPKRLKKDTGRSAALAKLKQLKGSKYKYEINDVEHVYEEVDENEYTRKVLDRQENDWIVDDDGSGYVEDGREIFDDDLDSESIAMAAASKGKSSKRKKKAISSNAGKGNLQYMLSNMPAKKKEEAGLDDDDVLSELISEIDQPNTSVYKENKEKMLQRFSLLSEKIAVKDYMMTFVSNTPKAPIRNTNKTIDKNEDVINEKENMETNINCATTSIAAEVTNSAATAVTKSKLLFKIEEPKIQVKEEQNSLLEEPDQLSMMDFDDDFDFDAVENVAAKVEKQDESEITEEQLSSGFIFSGSNQVADESDTHNVPDFLEEGDKEGFLFYWWDAHEDSVKKPGVILLFGKTFSEEKKKYVSCCVVVKNIQRKIYLLPRSHFLGANNEPSDKPVSIMDVYQEFNDDVARASSLISYKSRKVTKGYAFDPTVPLESEYLEVRYDGFINLRGKAYKTFSRVFGMESSFLEIFLLDRKIKGPCWLRVVNGNISTNPFTHTAVEIICSKPMNLSVVQSNKPLQPPPLVVLSLNIKVASTKSSAYEIALISCLVNNKYHLDKNAPDPPFQEHFCVFTKLSNSQLPQNIHVALSKYKSTKVQKIDTERGLLNYFIAQFSRIDPDLIVSHDLPGYQLNILGIRLQAVNPTNYSRLSRIKRANGNFHKQKMERQIFTGRLVCDIKISAKELIRSRSFDLDSLCQTVLKVPQGQRIEIEPENVQKMYETATDLFKMISLTMQDTAYILKMMYELNVIPLALQITNIAGNIMSKTLMGGRSERNEFLLLHAFSEKDYIAPEKAVRKFEEEKESKTKRKKPTYSGGLVLDPKVGFYDKLILLMDFNSLYPSIIQEYNVCFTTISGTSLENIILPEKNIPPGILPTEIRKLVESRRMVKKLMNNPDLLPDVRMQYHIRQMALKLTANSMYGCLGFSNSRFFAKNLAALVTQKGREILTNTRDIVQKLNYDVIYGDTDSIMINTNNLDYEQVMKIGKSIKLEINKLYKQIELDIDGVFKYLLLLKKKKYAAVTLQKGKTGKLVEQQEFKGLDIVRRDWSQLAAEAGKFILNQILSEQTSDERIEKIQNHLGKLKEDITLNQIPLPLLIITKQLTKDPELYNNKNAVAHVLVALRHNKKKGKKFKSGDTVPYVICKDGTSNSATQRGYLLEELKNSENLSLDSDYYLAHQIHPVITRICEPIDGMDSYQIAECLGLDASHFKKPPQHRDNNSVQLSYENFKKPEVKFRDVEPFVFNCIECQNEIKISLTKTSVSLARCSNLKCNVRPVDYLGYVQNCLVLQIRKFIQKYYKGELTCEDPGCVNLTDLLPQKFTKFCIYPICTTCYSAIMYKTYSEEELYCQIMYFQHIFDVAQFEKGAIEPNLESAYNLLKETAENFLNQSAYGTISLMELFSPLISTTDEKQTVELDASQIYDEEAED